MLCTSVGHIPSVVSATAALDTEPERCQTRCATASTRCTGHSAGYADAQRFWAGHLAVEVVSIVADVLLAVALVVGVVVLRSFRSGAEQFAKDQATEIGRQINRAAVLARELERIRGTERQELRFTSYGKLWAKMRPLAIYDDSPINRETMKKMSKQLSDWYFLDSGGLMLTSHNRDLYFALQDLLSRVANAETEWEAERIPKPKKTFEAVLERRGLTNAQGLIEHLDKAGPQNWPSDDLEELARAWSEDVVSLATGWVEINSRERFAVLQQVCSVLRTGLTNDVESRLR